MAFDRAAEVHHRAHTGASAAEVVGPLAVEPVAVNQDRGHVRPAWDQVGSHVVLDAALDQAGDGGVNVVADQQADFAERGHDAALVGGVYTVDQCRGAVQHCATAKQPQIDVGAQPGVDQR